MKGYKKNLALIMSALVSLFAVSGCDFIVKDEPVDIDNYSMVENETPDSVNDSSENTESDTTKSDTEQEDKKDSSSDKKDNSKDNKDNKDDKDKSVSSKTTSSKNTSSKTTSSKTTSSRATSSKTTSSKATSSATTSSKTTSSKTTSSNTTSSNDEGKVKEISLDIKEVTLNVGESKMPIVTMTPISALNKSEIWKSSNEKIATVDSNGRITAVAEGKCEVTVTSADNEKVSATVSVTVNGGQKVEKIEVNFNEKTIKIGESVMPTVNMTPLDADTLAESWTSSNDLIATVDEKGNITGHSEGVCKITVSSVSNPQISQEIIITVDGGSAPEPDVPEPNEDITEETYIGGVLVVNKSYGLPENYNPGGLTSECAEHFEDLRHAAADDDIIIYLSSGFRSYETQRQLYNGYVNTYGQAVAETFSARPGYSEHQTGLAIDCNIVNDSFIGTPEAEWLEEHCHEYGFIIRYPKGKESVTGYKYEPWHIRYVGEYLAEQLHNSGLTLEEYLGVSSYYQQ